MKILFLLHSLGVDERLGIMTLSSILKQNGHAVRLLMTGGLALKACIERIKQFGPEVLAYSVMTGEHAYHAALNEKIKQAYPCFAVFGGPHPTYKPEMVELPGVDAVCRGEGDIFFPELLEKMSRNKDFYSTPNFWFKKPDGTVVKNEIGPLVSHLDALPFPDRELVYDADILFRSRGKKTFMTMRGCPYTCSYCFNHAYNRLTRGKGPVLRYRSVDNVISEIKAVKAFYPLERVSFEDDTFLLKPAGWLEEFADRYAREINIPLTCNVRSDLVDAEKARLLKEMGCVMVFAGVDPPDEEILSRTLKRNVTMEQTMNACRLLRKHDIKVATESLMGLPVDDPLGAAMATLDFNIRVKPYLALTFMLYPYPGTEIARLAVEKKMFPMNHDKQTAPNRAGTVLIYRDEKTKVKLLNLLHLFSVIVQFPFLRPLTPMLISLPANRLYPQVYFFFFGYKMLRLSGRKIFARTILRYLPYYLRYIRLIWKQQI
ncbi:MAG: radical SAM protein [Thermodesulfobacteriota bacterium]